MALAGRDYFTIVGMLAQIKASVACDVESGHLSQTWGWKQLQEHKCCPTMRNLDPAHAFRFYRSGGIYMQWKQWCTDEQWCRPVLLVPEEHMQPLALFRPPCLDMKFSAGQAIWGLDQPI